MHFKIPDEEVFLDSNNKWLVSLQMTSSAGLFLLDCLTKIHKFDGPHESINILLNPQN